MAVFSDLEKDKQRQKIDEAKMATLGIASAGIAHELGNALQSFEYNIYKLEERLQLSPSDNDGPLEIENLKNALRFMGQIVRSISSYSAGRSHVIDGVSVNVAVDSALDLLNGYIRHSNVKVTKDYARHIPPLKTDPNQLQQIIVNLLKNSVQAMETTAVKNLTVRTVFSENVVEVRIQDTGVGIPKNMMDKIFCFFESTRDPDEGNGIGLAIGKELADRNNMTINVTSEENKGAEFIVSAPCAQSSSPLSSRMVVVGDNYTSLQDTLKSLHEAGYYPFSATRKGDALKLMDLQPIQWVICEHNMFPVPGLELAVNFLEDQKCSVAVVGAPADVIKHGKGNPGILFLPKKVEPRAWKSLFTSR